MAVDLIFSELSPKAPIAIKVEGVIYCKKTFKPMSSVELKELVEIVNNFDKNYENAKYYRRAKPEKLQRMIAQEEIKNENE